MADYQYGVQYPYDGAVFCETSDYDEVIAELLWAMEQREILAAKEDWEAPRFADAHVVVRERGDDADEWGAWASLDISDDEIRDAARESAGEVD